MASSVFIASAEGHTAKSLVALGAIRALSQRFTRVNVFRTISTDANHSDPILELLHQEAGSLLNLAECVGVDYQLVHENPDAAISQTIQRFKAVEAVSDAVLVLGSDYTDVFSPAEFKFNARLAANLATPMVLVFNGRDVYSASESIGQAAPRNTADLASIAEVVRQEIESANTHLLAAVVNRADESQLEPIRVAIASVLGESLPVWAVPEDPRLLAPRMSQLMESVSGRLVYGKQDQLQAEVMALVVAAMNAEHVLERISEDAVVVVPSDRTDVLLSLLMADASSTFPKLAGLVLNGGFKISEPIDRLIAGLEPRVPVVETLGNSFETTLKVTSTRG
ncbi:MAG: DRTGG domain-containing protein, partial [Micrococcales bacterium]